METSLPMLLGRRVRRDEEGNAEIAEFLKMAGLRNGLSQRATTEELTREERRRWVYGDVIVDAVKLVVSKYGHEDSCDGRPMQTRDAADKERSG